MEKSYHRHRRLLRARRDGPCSCRAADQGYELASLQVIELHFGPLPARAELQDIESAAVSQRGGAPPVAVAVLAGWKAELGKRRGEAEALRSCRKSFLGATVRCSRRCHLRSKARSRSSGYRSEVGTAVSSLLVRTAGDDGCSTGRQSDWTCLARCSAVLLVRRTPNCRRDCAAWVLPESDVDS